MKTGIYDIPDEEYFATDGLSNTYLWSLINKTPAHAQIPMTPTDAMDLGKAVHLAVLQPELADKGIVQGPKDRRGKAWKEAVDKAEKAGTILLVEKDYHTCMTMRDRVWQNSTFAAILSGKDAKYEYSAFWQYHGKQCKLKVDCAKPRLIIDLKTSADASPRGFAQSVAKYGYHQQGAGYKYGWSQASGEPIDAFLFLVIEKTPPYAPAIYELDAPSMAEGWASYNAAINLHIECEAAKHFPAYPAEKVLLQLPPYAFNHTNPRTIDITGVN
jgi:hypothetical protein